MRDWNAVCLFCEDVREEKHGDTLLGIFPDNINVTAIPSAMPKLGVYVRIHINVDSKIQSISAKLRTSTGEEMPFGGFDAAKIKNTLAESSQKGAPTAGFIIRGTAVNFPIKTAGRSSMLVKIDDEEIICGSMNFQVGPNPSATASPQPSSQSPSVS